MLHTIERCIVAAAFCIVLVSGRPALAACSEPGDAHGAVAFDECLSASSANSTWRYLAVYTGGDVCPGVNDWSGARLFDDTAGALPIGLDTFCVYTRLNEEASPSQLNAIVCSDNDPPTSCLREVEPDIMALTFLAGSVQGVEGLLWNDFNRHFLSQSGATGPLPPSPQAVRLAVIDTEPSGLNEDRNGSGLSGHGFTLLNLARDMMCPDTGPCPVQLRSTIGLPLQRCSTAPGASCPCASVPLTGMCLTPATGGHMGSIGQLARAIHAELRNFDNSGLQRLVINLSVGWDPRYGGEPPIANGPIATRAVAAALQNASCRGAIVVAAAGNKVPGPEPSVGPLLPGAWESVAAPDAAACQAILNGPPDPTLFPVPGTAYRPLLWAAGAIDHGNRPTMTRDNGEPRLVAFGDHAVAGAPAMTGTEPTSTLTGSSVASLVTAATAAAAWHYRPNEPAYAIMQTLYDTAANIGLRSADFCLDQGSGCGLFAVRRVNACEGIGAVCSQFPGSPCPNFACPAELPVLPAIPVGGMNAVFSAAPAVDVSAFTRDAAIADCGPEYKLHWANGAATPANPCPHLQYYGLTATPWTDGQPAGQACELCVDVFASPGNLYLEVKVEFEGPLQDVTLLCRNDGWRVANSMNNGDLLKITRIPAGCEPNDLAVAFRVESNGVSQASVLSLSLKAADRDDDTVQDGADNCLEASNVQQLDGDNDGIGNVCDADFNNDCVVNVIDLGFLRGVFFTPNPVADLNGDGIVNVIDLAIVKQLFFAAPGPSGVPNVCVT